MRVTHHGLVERVINNTENRIELIAKSQEQVSTGLRVLRPSDDPAVAGEIMKLRSLINRQDQYRQNIRSGLANLNMTENALEQLRDLVIRTRALALKGANATLKPEDRQAIADYVDQNLRELLTIANRKSGGRYLFGGTETRYSPFHGVENTEGKLEDIIPRSLESQNPIELLYGEGERAEISISALDTFDLGDGDTIFRILTDLRQALNEDDTLLTGDVLPRLDEALDQLNALSALVGARINSSNMLLDQIDQQEITLTGRISDLGDVDIIKAMVRLNEEMVSYELGLRMSAKVIQPSLVNFVYL